jgi:hypothetical protein
MSRCPNCRRPVDETDRVCDFCDEQLDNRQNAKKRDQPRRNQHQSTGRKNQQSSAGVNDETPHQNDQGTDQSHRKQQQSARGRTTQTDQTVDQDRPNSGGRHRQKSGNDYSGQQTRQNTTRSTGQQQDGYGKHQEQHGESQSNTVVRQQIQSKEINNIDMPELLSKNITLSTGEKLLGVIQYRWLNWAAELCIGVLLIGGGAYLTTLDQIIVEREVLTENTLIPALILIIIGLMTIIQVYIQKRGRGFVITYSDRVV